MFVLSASHLLDAHLFITLELPDSNGNEKSVNPALAINLINSKSGSHLNLPLPFLTK